MGKAKLSERQWTELRLAYESGRGTQRALAREFGIAHTTLQSRIKAEGWYRNPSKEVEVATIVHLTGIPTTGNEEDRLAAVEVEAARRANVIRRHRDEWDGLEKYREMSLKELETAQPREVTNEDGLVIAVIEPSYRKTFAFKAQVEALASRQKAERLAWGLDHNANADRIEDAKKRDAMIAETMGAIKEAVAKARGPIIDVTPNKEGRR